MSIISLYISRNMLRFFAGVLFVFIFVVFMVQFSQIFTYAMQYGADMLWVLGTAAWLLPDIFALSIPIAFQIAILMTLTSMGQNGEIMALRAAGFSFREIARPILAAAILLCALMLWLTGWVSPRGRLRVYEAKEDIAAKITKVNIEPKTFISLGDWDLFAENVDKKTNVLEGVHLSRKNDASALSTKVNAADGKIDVGGAGINLVLNKGQLQRLDARAERKIITAEFRRYNIYIPLSQKTASKRVLRAAELTTPQLLAALRGGKIKAQDAKTYRPEPAYRVSMSLAVLAFFVLGCPAAFVTTKKAGRGAAMLFSIVFIFAYFGLLTVGDVLGRQLGAGAAAFCAPLLPAALGLCGGWYWWRKKLSD
ncbi:MAG: LptF/LptG family permease [Elusimicrobiota bacterium]|jgi:LPS export ABC transporter permease LptF|nr:LptF/LptG family permease [Elusimicrobiota bacterium]